MQSIGRRDNAENDIACSTLCEWKYVETEPSFYGETFGIANEKLYLYSKHFNAFLFVLAFVEWYKFSD